MTQETKIYSDFIKRNGVKVNSNKPTHGGSRPNSGRKPKPYKTKVLSFRVRVEHVAEVKKVVKAAITRLTTD